MLQSLDDRIQFTLQWVWGMCVLWARHTKQFDQLSDQKLEDYVHQTHTVVWRYLNRQQVLDGSCSDLECWVATQAVKLFGMFTDDQSQQVVSEPELIELTANPEAIRTLKPNDEVKVRGQVMVFNRISSKLLCGSSAYLTVPEPPSHWSGREYRYVHLRQTESPGNAVMTDDEMINRLRTGDFVIR